MKENFGLCSLLAISLCIASLAMNVASYPMQELNGGPLSNTEFSPKVVYQNPGPSLDRMRYFLADALQKYAAQSNMKKAKKTCLLNAGLSHSCDYRDALAAIDEGMYLGSDQTPGRK